MKLLKLLLLAALLGWAGAAVAQSAVTVTLTAEPSEGVETVTPTLTWQSTGAVSCTASGGWTGPKPVTGRETVPAVDRTTEYGLTCTGADGFAQVSWQAPVAYTNGEPIAATGDDALGGFAILYGFRGESLSVRVDVPDPAATSYRIEGLSAGEREFRMTAYTNAGVESERSAAAYKVVTIPASEASATVTVRMKPEPPVVTVESVVYEIKLHPQTQVASLGRQVGVIAYGVACEGEPIVSRGRGDYYQVPSVNVHLTKEPKSSIVVARCGAEG